jgi:hypothetical protein
VATLTRSTVCQAPPWLAAAGVGAGGSSPTATASASAERGKRRAANQGGSKRIIVLLRGGSDLLTRTRAPDH